MHDQMDAQRVIVTLVHHDAKASRRNASDCLLVEYFYETLAACADGVADGS